MAPAEPRVSTRVAHLSVFRTGGAGVAAGRLHQALRQHGVRSTFASCDAPDDADAGWACVPHRYAPFHERIAGRFGLYLSQTERFRQWRKRHGVRGLPVSSPRSDRDLSQLPAVEEADIVHLHWVSDLLDWPTFFSRCRKPIVWTLHDMNPFLGAFHYAEDRERATPELRDSDAKALRLKLAQREQLSTVSCVAPSQWLSDEAAASELMGQSRHFCIPYGIDTRVFAPYDRKLTRAVFGLPADKRVILLVAEDLGSHRKGADLIAETLERAQLGSDWVVAAAGSGTLPPTSLEVVRVGTVADERLMAQLYSTADLYLLPSRADNLPNTLIEAITCGTPCVSTQVGGIPEIITDGLNGALAVTPTADALATALRCVAETPFDRDAIRSDAAQRFDAQLTASRYAELYDDILTTHSH